MTKFGDIINAEVPVLIDFYANWENESYEFSEELRKVAAALGDKAKVIKIDVEKNETLAEALRIKGNPTYVIYKDGEMKWRQVGEQDANSLITLMQEYL